MKPISADVVEQTWKRLGVIPPEDATVLIDVMRKEQPSVLAYLTAVGEGQLTEDEMGLLLHIGIVVWQAMRQGDAQLPMVSGEDLDAVESKNVQMLEYFEGESEASFYDVAERLFGSYNQYEILRHIVGALMEEQEEDLMIRDENLGIMYIYLKTVLDAMDL